ncbi:unnamed protein product [Ceutorhynchus assimilis]|uniref:Receptor-binding cancer antigen expressed on SiSo cells n=1 Tax=Ceutorhynchus assimilis TaxID=467358 RepID=A0A9N9QRT8_9CUCU|nr:unnamed protein product [Ceutorhynchus assimilis]
MINLIFYKIKSFFLVFINLLRRALCCFRKRRHSFKDSETLTHVISNLEEQNDAPNWSEWGDNFKDHKPKTVQDYIELYREQAVKARTAVEKAEEDSPEQQFFEDMAPQIMKQTKVFVRSKNDTVSKRTVNTRLNAVEDTVNIIPSGELGEWDENSGWDGEQLLDEEAQKVLREQKRLEREKRAWEQHQKRLEKASQSCLNYRPLYPLSHDSSDLNPLTPAHLLIGESLTGLPDHNFMDVKGYREHNNFTNTSGPDGLRST